MTAASAHRFSIISSAHCSRREHTEKAVSAMHPEWDFALTTDHREAETFFNKSISLRRDAFCCDSDSHFRPFMSFLQQYSVFLQNNLQRLNFYCIMKMLRSGGASIRSRQNEKGVKSMRKKALQKAAAAMSVSLLMSSVMQVQAAADVQAFPQSVQDWSICCSRPVRKSSTNTTATRTRNANTKRTRRRNTGSCSSKPETSGRRTAMMQRPQQRTTRSSQRPLCSLSRSSSI